MSSYSSGPIWGFVESGDGTLSTYEEDVEGNFSNLDFKEVVSRLSFTIKFYIDPDAAIAARDERQTLFFTNNFREPQFGTLVI